MPFPDSEFTRWFSEEVQPHEAALRTWLWMRFPGLQDVDDVVQEACTRLLRARETGSIACPRSFLFATARNLALNHLRHQRHERLAGVAEVDAAGVLDDSAAIPDSVANAEGRAEGAERKGSNRDSRQRRPKLGRPGSSTECEAMEQRRDTRRLPHLQSRGQPAVRHRRNSFHHRGDEQLLRGGLPGWQAGQVDG
jgi:hypothetical protein